MPQAGSGEISKEILSGIGITIFLFAISVYLPILGFAFTLFIPLPIIYYRAKLGRQASLILASFASIVIVFLIGNVSVDTIFFCLLTMLGFLIGEALSMNLSIERSMLYPCGAIFLNSIIFLFFYNMFSSGDIFTIISEYVRRNLQIALETYKSVGISQEQISFLSQSFDSIHYILVRIIPALVSVFILVTSWINILISKQLFTLKGINYPDFGQLKLWKLPESLIWGVIGCGILLLIPDKSLKILGLNGIIIFLTIYFFQGMAIVSFFFEKRHLPTSLKIFLYSLIVIQQFFLFIVIGLGIFDMWVNFRKI